MTGIRVTWRVGGMHCVHCETSIEKALSSLRGLNRPHASFRRGTLSALWDEQALSLDDIAACLQKEGYTLLQRTHATLWRSILSFIKPLLGIGLLYILMTQTPLSRWMNAFPVAASGMGLGMLFVVGLMTSLHCVAMCGGISIAQSAHAAQQGHKPSRASLLYNMGRVISYTVIGGIIGALGMTFNLSNATKAFIQIAAAVFMLIMALNLLGGPAWLRVFTISLPRGLKDKIFAKSAGRAPFYTGLANGLMPCGPLQSMQLFALSSGSWWMGALSMLVFSLGTVPLMLLIGLLGGRLNRRFAKPMRVFSALLVVMLGMYMLTNGLALAGIGLTKAPAAVDGFAQIASEKQSVRTELGYGRYSPITVQAGLPVEWVLHADAKSLNGCNNAIVIPAFNLSIALQPGDNIIEFTPTQSGVIPFSCWMGMIRSSIYVVEKINDIK